MAIKFLKGKNNLIKDILFCLFIVIFMAAVGVGAIVEAKENRKLRSQVDFNEQIIEKQIEKRLDTVHSYIEVIENYNPDLDSLFVFELASGVYEASQKHNLESHIILTTIAHESMFNPDAKALTSNATGLGQIIPYHWGEKYNFVKRDLFDWRFNLDITCEIINQMKKRHGRRKDWIAYYYSAEQPGRGNYFRGWSRKNRYIKYLLKKHEDNGVGAWRNKK